mmetsp:Transcript_50037/g.73491  ORF Transcript_50037/g.73491 Transcript_50037/m.73491 type:complete len:284 (-) Transcript_50037:143-994(-)
MRARGVEECHLTLHVGAGTFRPIDCDSTADHTMHAEWVSLSAAALSQLREAVSSGRPIVPVGTTSVRTLESIYWWGVKLIGKDASIQLAREISIDQWDPYRLTHQAGSWEELPSVSESLDAVLFWAQSRVEEEGGGEVSVVGQTQLLIVPGYRFALCDYLFTNTHQPRSTLLMLVSALVGGHKRIQDIYLHALDNDYRFLSYGDSNFLACHQNSVLNRLPKSPSTSALSISSVASPSSAAASALSISSISSPPSSAASAISVAETEQEKKPTSNLPALTTPQE